ncbi:hypothetical protein EXIGLDRAFT_769356 [Exidia glandulosa HHB12029]|uniref:Uncharacterized protein n=1 Tax=Exidia glandulosa HHB12029 TaxID=1314781 RepID=A0A165HJK9_EXIGL|nr:hypothetical protein EXIGLDRAFT_769356 [Exidia glandulosa HHB12029]
MPKGCSAPSGNNWLVEHSIINVESGWPEHLPNNKYWKEHINMVDMINPATAEVQPLYFPDDHPTHPSMFKGMAQILVERVWQPSEFARGLNVQRPNFKCPDLTNPYTGFFLPITLLAKCSINSATSSSLSPESPEYQDRCPRHSNTWHDFGIPTYNNPASAQQP